MKRLFTLIRDWRYRRLYKRLVFAYLKHESTSICAYSYADSTFLAITGYHYFPDKWDA